MQLLLDSSKVVLIDHFEVAPAICTVCQSLEYQGPVTAGAAGFAFVECALVVFGPSTT